MPKDFETLVEELRYLRKTEEEAKNIIEQAQREVEKMFHEAEEKSARIMTENEANIRKLALENRAAADEDIKAVAKEKEEEFCEERSKLREKAEGRTVEALKYIINGVLRIGSSE